MAVNRKSTLFAAVATVTLALLTGCESQPRDLSLGQEETFDGLRQVKNTLAYRV